MSQFCSLTPAYECDDAYLPAHQAASALIDLLLSQGVNEHHLLKGTGLFLNDVQQGYAKLSAAQLLQLIANSEKLYRGDDLPFLWGNRLWPGNFGPFSHAMTSAANLEQALEHIVSHSAILSPLVSFRVYQHDDWLFLHWLDINGCGKQQAFIFTAMMTALAGMTRWLSEQALPWKFFLQQEKPLAYEQFAVHWNDSVRFNTQLNVMALPLEYLQQPWPKHSPTSFRVAQQECSQLRAGQAQTSFVDVLYRWLLQHIREPISLETTAAAFAISPATLKRKLKKHNLSFQQACDEVRKHYTLYLMAVENLSNEEIALRLGYHNANNLRRSFRRWTGLTPNAIRLLLDQLSLSLNN